MVFENSTLDLTDMRYHRYTSDYVESALDENRIESSLPLLESLVIHAGSERDGMFCTTTKEILNTIGNQILSLHIGGKIYTIGRWKFLLKLREVGKTKKKNRKRITHGCVLDNDSKAALITNVGDSSITNDKQ